jgi:topoisomerase-4 subunit B
LSEYLELTVYRDGYTYTQKFENGGSVIHDLKKGKKTTKTGTTIHFMPDSKIFKKINFNFSTISERLREDAFLLKGIEMELHDERTDRHENYYYENGLEEFINWLNSGKHKSISKVLSFDDDSKEIEVEVALQFTDGYQENIVSFVNLVRTSDGGTHEMGFKSGLTKVFNEYARKYDLLKKKDKNLEGTDVREGLTTPFTAMVGEGQLRAYNGNVRNHVKETKKEGAKAIVSGVKDIAMQFVSLDQIFGFITNKTAPNIIKHYKQYMRKHNAKKRKAAFMKKQKKQAFTI